jgi:tripartite-type tricarboxylate transporter receptor subunit TctC
MFEASQAINATLYDKLNFVFLRDIAPVACIIRTPLVMEVHPSVPAKTVPEFIAYAKANPGKINQSSPGAGTSTHMAGDLRDQLGHERRVIDENTGKSVEQQGT